MTTTAQLLALKRVVVTATPAHEPELYEKAMELGVAAYLREPLPRKAGNDATELVRVEVVAQPEAAAQVLAFVRTPGIPPALLSDA